MTVAGIPEKIIDLSLVTSLAVFGIRVFAKEVKAVLGDIFQVFEFVLRWWIMIRVDLVREAAQKEVVGATQLSE